METEIMDVPYEYYTDPTKEGLWVPENQIVPLVYRVGKDKPHVNSRMLHKVLGIQRQHANWIENAVKAANLVENTDFLVFNVNVKNPDGGRPAQHWLLSVHAAKEIALRSRGKNVDTVRKYFIHCEETLRGILSSQATRMPSNIDYSNLNVAIADILQHNSNVIHLLQNERQVLINYIDEKAEIVASVEAMDDSDELSFRIRDFVKLTGTSRVPIKLKEMAFRQQLIDDGLIYAQPNKKNGIDYYPKASASQWFVSKISRRKQNGKWVKDVVLRITEKGACYLLCRYCGVDRKTAQEVVGKANDNPNSAASATGPPTLPRSSDPPRNLLEPSQFAENGIAKSMTAKSAVVA